jgi:hypothetical protein
MSLADASGSVNQKVEPTPRMIQRRKDEVPGEGRDGTHHQHAIQHVTSVHTLSREHHIRAG